MSETKKRKEERTLLERYQDYLAALEPSERGDFKRALYQPDSFVAAVAANIDETLRETHEDGEEDVCDDLTGDILTALPLHDGEIKDALDFTEMRRLVGLMRQERKRLVEEVAGAYFSDGAASRLEDSPKSAWPQMLKRAKLESNK